MINKNFVSIYDLLMSNKDMLVSDILDDCVVLMHTEVSDKVTRYNEDGNLEIYCWYHKKWEDTTEIDYGSKKSTKTGLNTFCKVGVNCWTKQQRDYKTQSAKVLIDVAEGKLKPEDIQSKLIELGVTRDLVETRDDYFIRIEAEKQEKLLAK